MSDLSSKFSTLEAEITSIGDEAHLQRVTSQSTLEDIQSAIATLNSDMLLMKSALLNAIASSAACSPCPTPPLLGTPVDPTTHPTNPDKCKRVQALLHTIGEFCDFADGVGTLSTAFTPGFVTGVIDSVRTANSDSGIPVPGWIDTLTIAADGVNFVINRALEGGGCHATFDPLVADLQSALFAASTPVDAKSAYDAAIEASSGLGASKPLLEAMGFSDLFNYYLDTANSPNLTGFDGGACGLPGGCYVFAPEDCITVSTEDGPKVIPDWTIYGLTIQTNLGHDNAIWVAGDWRGWSWTISENTMSVYHVAGATHPEDGFGLTGTYGSGLDVPSLGTFVSAAAFALTFCPPGS